MTSDIAIRNLLFFFFILLIYLTQRECTSRGSSGRLSQRLCPVSQIYLIVLKMTMGKQSSKKRVQPREGGYSEHCHQMTLASGNSDDTGLWEFRTVFLISCIQKSISLNFQKCNPVLIQANKAHKRLMYKAIIPLYSHTMKTVITSLDTCSIQLDQYIYISLVNRYFLKSQVQATSRQVKGQAKSTEACSANISEQS